MTTIYFHGEAAASETLLATLATNEAAVFGDLPGLCVLAPTIAADALANATCVLAPYSPRAIRWLADFAGAALAPSVDVIDSRQSETLPAARATPEAIAAVADMIDALDPPGDWRPWYPVLDRELCTACGQCVSFCLFGVYRKDGETVQVVEPTKCKNNCPACARACPQKAIIFPKCDERGIDGYPGNASAEGGKKLAGSILDQLRARTGSAAVPPEIAERLKHIDPDTSTGGEQ
ncbi:MAG: 4Fe-4S binding protein [Phycisphaerales bacterium]|jgi:Pyruvate/2-oxoacid:ferredoxin oxidoreductase delta subunit|nr:4Fe-4S binding protein [Phycisphaerales bacterium]MBT7171220.1 4Fe-4S binding protein [Phycisphaerales bacterium]